MDSNEMIKSKGLNSFQLKLIALILMIFDHIHEFFSYTGNIPILFKWTGRIVAPIFMFLIVEGYIHTKNKKKYMIRLYIGSIVMSFGNYIMSTFLARADGFLINNNIFSTFLMIVIYMKIIDFLKQSILEKDSMRVFLSTIFFIMPFVIGSSIISITNVTKLEFLKYVIPNIFLVEGGPIFVLLGIVFYVTRDDIAKLIQSYLIFIFSILLASLVEGNFDIKQLFLENYQWMMILSIPFFKSYNGEKGKGLKYLFYMFYPVHIYLLYIISYILID